LPISRSYESLDSVAADGRPDNSASSQPIPKAQKGDLEDVSWALSTAEASWQRGDRMESLKWLRRAAEAATEGSMNARALFLAKAAADLTSALSSRSSSPSASPPRLPNAPPVVVPRAAPLAQAKKPPQQAATPPVPARPAAPQAGVPRPMAASVHAAIMPPRAGQSGQAAPVSAPGARLQEPRKIRKSSQSLEIEARASRVAPAPSPKAAPPASPPSSTEARRRRAGHSATADVDAPTEPGNRDSPLRRAPSVADEMDAWPTENMSGGLDDTHSELTEAAPGLASPAADRAVVSSRGAAPGVSQAVRVLVWRTPEGLRIAPAGTPVQASVTAEALLVALDPSSDLAAWLVRR
jgi:hypothetical protein